MHIVFVHTPMAHRSVAGRSSYWHNFDIRYYAMHPNAKLMQRYLWELPHWVPWLGGVLVEQGFQSMEVLDFYTDHGALDGIDEVGIYGILKEHPGDVYLFSPMTTNLPHALQIADMIKELYPWSKIVFGGIVATPLHMEVADHPSVDYVVVDRGEIALPELLRAIEGQHDISSVGNITHKVPDGEVVSTLPHYLPIPVDQIPFPKVDIFPSDVGANIRYIRQVYALGCPYQCDYCTIQTIGRKPSYFKIERVLEEIRAYRAHYGEHHHIYFGDETFTLNTERTLELCSALEAVGDVYYDCQTRLNRLEDPRLPKALYSSGCRWIEIGIETANQKSLDLTHKRGKIFSTELTLATLRDEGIPACAYMMVGFPNESTDDMKRTIDWACSLIGRGLLHASYLSVLVPYPGSPMFAHPEHFGMRIHHHNYELYHEDLVPVFDSEFARAEETYEIFLQGVRRIAEAMAQQPYLSGTRFRTQEDLSYGAYWRDPL